MRAFRIHVVESMRLTRGEKATHNDLQVASASQLPCPDAGSCPAGCNNCTRQLTHEQADSAYSGPTTTTTGWHMARYHAFPCRQPPDIWTSSGPMQARPGIIASWGSSISVANAPDSGAEAISMSARDPVKPLEYISLGLRQC